ncbi:NfeD family protein [bacterium]|nr:NfeD family protein [bacterium]
MTFDFAHLTAQNWFTIAVGLVVLEILLPGTFLMWLGIAAAIVGGVLLIFSDLGWEGQILLFSVFSVASIWQGRRVLAKAKAAEPPTTLNIRGKEHIGQTVKVETAIEGGMGRVRVQDTSWVAYGPDCSVGTMVRITALEGNAFRVVSATPDKP